MQRRDGRPEEDGDPYCKNCSVGDLQAHACKPACITNNFVSNNHELIQLCRGALVPMKAPRLNFSTLPTPKLLMATSCLLLCKTGLPASGLQGHPPKKNQKHNFDPV